MARYHSEYNEKTASKSLKSLKDRENKDMQTYLLKHRKTLWDAIQERVIEIYKSTTNYFFNLSVRELYDVLALTNKFLEIGLDFAQPKECVLLDEILSLCNRYMKDFKDTQFTNLKDFLHSEEWVRLPLPDNYEVKEFKELLQDYPEDFKSNIKIFENHFSGRIVNRDSENIFLQFCEGNPFDHSELMNQSKIISPDKVSFPRSSIIFTQVYLIDSR